MLPRSPARINPLQAPGVSGDFGLGVEFPLVFKPTGFARTFVRSRFIKIFAGKWMPAFAMRLRPADCGNRWVFPKSRVREKRLTQNLVDWLSVSPASLNSSSRNVQMPRPLCNGHGLPIESQIDVIPTVVTLLNSPSPLAVFWRVRAIIVDTFDGHFGRTVSHVFKKLLKGLPSFTDGDTSGSVVAVSVVSRIGAARKDAGPNYINLRTTHSVFGVSAHVFTFDLTGGHYIRL